MVIFSNSSFEFAFTVDLYDSYAQSFFLIESYRYQQIQNINRYCIVRILDLITSSNLRRNHSQLQKNKKFKFSSCLLVKNDMTTFSLSLVLLTYLHYFVQLFFCVSERIFKFHLTLFRSQRTNFAITAFVFGQFENSIGTCRATATL